MKRICIVTGTRAEYGLLMPLMKSLNENPEFDLQILVTGAHLSPEFGLTTNFIEQDGFKIDEKIEMLVSADTPSGIVKSMGLGMIGYADAFSRMKPDSIVILGDRYEMLSVASAAVIFNIPIIHLHGGEITEGAYDDAIRHAITKLSSLHFTSTDSYRRRVIQMGELPQRVYNVGAIGIDNMYTFSLLTREQLEKKLGICFAKYNFQVTFHPETLSNFSSKEQFKILLDVIDLQEDSFFIFTKANADTDGRIINQMIDDYVTKNPSKSAAFNSLGSLNFLSLVNICSAIVGNSSSGIIEAPSLKTPTINVGDRQRGRIQAASVLNCSVDYNEISLCFQKIKDPSFIKSMEEMENPYGDGNTTKQIIEILSSIDFEALKTKEFYNINNI